VRRHQHLENISPETYEEQMALIERMLAETKQVQNPLINNKVRPTIMIIAKLMQGLGNQMFQYALGRHLSEKYQVELKLDVTSFFKVTSNKRLTPRKYQLDYFDIHGPIATPADINRFIPEKNDAFSQSPILIEKNMSFDPNVLTSGPDVFLIGFWQSEKYFAPVNKIIRNEFILREDLISGIDAELVKKYLSEIRATNSVSIHFRRSDYVTTFKNTLGACPTSYYSNAIKYISSYIENIHLYIFSDDVKWVSNNFVSDFPYTIVSSNKGYDFEDLFLMSQCKHNIIANSTFSWWGAWLNNNDKKIVLAPNQWYKNEKKNSQTGDLIPDEWIRI
jgi:hypothetical protein